jgi:hypothetical protein
MQHDIEAEESIIHPKVIMLREVDGTLFPKGPAHITKPELHAQARVSGMERGAQAAEVMEARYPKELHAHPTPLSEILQMFAAGRNDNANAAKQR